MRQAIVNLSANHRRSLANRRKALSRLQISAAPFEDTYPSDLNELLRLPPQERAVLYLSEIEGYHYAEIGAMLGCSEAAARQRAMRGRRRLYARLSGEVADG